MTGDDGIDVLYVAGDGSRAGTVPDRLEAVAESFDVSATVGAGEPFDPPDGWGYDCLVCDSSLPATDGLDVLDRIRDRGVGVPFVLFAPESRAPGPAILEREAAALVTRTGDPYPRLANRIRTLHAATADAARRRFEAMFEHPASFVALLSPEGTVRRINGPALEFVGVDPETVRGEPFPETPWWNHSDALQEHLRQRIDRASDGDFQRFEAEHRSPDGETVTVDATLQPIEDDGGTVTGLVAIGRNVTERRERERELRRAETVIETVGDGVYVMDREGRFTMVNGAFRDLTGYEYGDLVGEHVSELLDEDGLEAARAIDVELERSDTDHVKREFELYTGSGEVVPCEVRVSAIERDGEFVSTAGVVRDLSDRIARERELRRKNELFEHTQELATVGGWELNLETDTLTWTDEVYRIQAVEDDFEPTLESAIQCYHPEDQPKIADAVEAAIEDDEPFDVELRVPTDDGTKWVRAIGARSTREDGDVLRGAVQDVTELKRRERKLRERTEQLEAFGRTVAHDLRNPLEIAQGYLDHVDADDRAAGEIRDALDRMESVVDDVLALAREGEAIGDREPVSVRTVAEDAWSTTYAESGSLSIDGDSKIRADRERLRTLFENLFRNAVEHGSTDSRGEHGSADDQRRSETGVEIRVGPLESGFYVEDDGNGIAPGLRERVFETGFSERDGPEASSGLGLSIVGRIVDAHGWRVRIVDAESGGARFEVRTN